MIIDLPYSLGLVPISSLEAWVSPIIYQSLHILLDSGFGPTPKFIYLPVQLYFLLSDNMIVCTASLTTNLSGLPTKYQYRNSKLIFNLTTLLSYRGTGLGREMLSWMVFNSFQDPLCNRLYIEVDQDNQPAYQLYLNFGFKPIDQYRNRILLKIDRLKIHVK